MNYYIIAGEASGDLHGSNLIKELFKHDIKAAIRCWGGDKMEAAGGTLVKHYRDLAFMGFTEVIKNLPAILSNLKYCKKDILAYKPDALILIDYPGFNLRIAKWARKNSFTIIYYISPQVWAWKENRVKAIKKNVDKMLVILPFEKEFYKKWNYDVEYVGHPLVEVIEDFKINHAQERLIEDRVIALLPGSRKQEISMKLPIMLKVAENFQGYHFVVGMAPGLTADFYDDLLKPYQNVTTANDQTYELLNHSIAALVTSGTATLETALFSVPEIVCYRGGKISYEIAKRLIRIKFISLVNLIMNKEVVKELIQDELTVQNLVNELDKLLNDTSKIAQVKSDYQALRNLLDLGGNASANAAKSIYQFLQVKNA